jgi:hypothetical protein
MKHGAVKAGFMNKYVYRYKRILPVVHVFYNTVKKEMQRMIGYSRRTTDCSITFDERNRQYSGRQKYAGVMEFEQIS